LLEGVVETNAQAGCDITAGVCGEERPDEPWEQSALLSHDDIVDDEFDDPWRNKVECSHYCGCDQSEGGENPVWSDEGKDAEQGFQ